MTEEFLINYAKENPEVKIYFKGKVGVHEKKFHNMPFDRIKVN